MPTANAQSPLSTQEYFINMGPQHPIAHGSLRLVVLLDGETVKKIIPVPGFVHRGIEKMCEHLNYRQIDSPDRPNGLSFGSDEQLGGGKDGGKGGRDRDQRPHRNDPHDHVGIAAGAEPRVVVGCAGDGFGRVHARFSIRSEIERSSARFLKKLSVRA